MVRDRFGDAYAPGKERGRGLGLDFGLVIRYGAAAMGAVLIVTGLVLALSVFGLIRGIIESPDTFVANLEAWTTDETDEAAPVIAPPAGQVPTATAQAAPESPQPTAPVETAPESTPPTGGVEQGDASADQNAEKTPQDVLEVLESRRNQAGRAVPIRPAPRNSEFENLFGEILELIREGGMGRIAGATFIFLFTALLARIPILLIRVGVQLLAASAKVKVSAVN